MTIQKIARAVGRAGGLHVCAGCARRDRNSVVALDGGRLNEKVNDLPTSSTQPVRLQGRAVYKGQYDESLAAGIAAFRAGNAPANPAGLRVGTATMMNARGAIVPVRQGDEGRRREVRSQGLRAGGGGTTPSNKGEMLSFPFNSSTTIPVLQQGRLQEGRPRPEQAARDVAGGRHRCGQAQAAGFACGYTHRLAVVGALESFSAWHNVLFATENNGFGGAKARLAFKRPGAGAAHRASARYGEEMATSPTPAARTSPRRNFIAGVRHGHAHRLVGGAGQHPQERQVSASARRPLPPRMKRVCRARRRTPSSVAPRCG